MNALSPCLVSRILNRAMCWQQPPILHFDIEKERLFAQVRTVELEKLRMDLENKDHRLAGGEERRGRGST